MMLWFCYGFMIYKHVCFFLSFKKTYLYKWLQIHFQTFFLSDSQPSPFSKKWYVHLEDTLNLLWPLTQLTSSFLCTLSYIAFVQWLDSLNNEWIKLTCRTFLRNYFIFFSNRSCCIIVLSSSFVNKIILLKIINWIFV